MNDNSLYMPTLEAIRKEATQAAKTAEYFAAKRERDEIIAYLTKRPNIKAAKAVEAIRRQEHK